MNTKNDSFPLHLLENIKLHPENYRLLEKIPLTIEGVDTHFPIILNPPLEGEKTYSVVFLDTETTGMDARRNRIIELGMVKATFSLDRKLLISVDRYYDEFEDPKTPIPEEISKLTGITDEMVKDHYFDDEMVARFLSGRPLVVAHNAAFDRPFFEERFSNLRSLSWCCSLKEIMWKDYGFGSGKLEFLNIMSGYFSEAHRAYVDCLALLWLMYIYPKAFANLIVSARTPTYKVVVKGNTYKFKDNLKQKDFRFDAGVDKSWSRVFTSLKDAEEVRSMLLDTYLDTDTVFEVNIIERDAKTRYKLTS